MRMGTHVGARGVSIAGLLAGTALTGRVPDTPHAHNNVEIGGAMAKAVLGKATAAVHGSMVTDGVLKAVVDLGGRARMRIADSARDMRSFCNGIFSTNPLVGADALRGLLPGAAAA